ncbi:MAG TPA: hypothetical protein DHV48_15845 [Prolixibacteraceae bacterium]|nr:hypothetical protein [Prolixibacteraceae bacterium]
MNHKISSFIILSLIVWEISAQSFLSTNKLWSTMSGPVSGCSSYFCSSYYTKFDGDTLVDGIRYMKALRSDDQQMKKWIIEGFIREETNKKVFYRDITAKEECLLYDFGCKAGDTLFLNCVCRESGFLVDSIKTFVNDGVARKYFYLTYLKIKTTKEVWIEGIGSTLGILNGGSFSHCMTGGGEALLCFTEDGIKKYQSPLVSNYCFLNPDIIDGISPEKTISEFKVYPNPVSGKLFVQFPAITAENYTLELYSVKGELVKTECVEAFANLCQIDVSSLRNGTYILRVILDSEKYAEEAIVIKQ